LDSPVRDSGCGLSGCGCRCQKRQAEAAKCFLTQQIFTRNLLRRARLIADCGAVSKKTIIAAITIAGLLISLVGVQVLEVARANPFAHYPYPLPYLTIQFPSNQSHNNPDVFFYTSTLSYSYEHVSNGFLRFETLKWVNYSLDGGASQPLEWTSPADYYSRGNETSFLYAHETYTNITLKGLSEGSHFISVVGETTFNNSLSSVVYFDVISATSVTPTPIPKPTLKTDYSIDLAMIAVVTLVVAVGALIYFKKLKK
jgi:hypothetical protein